MFWFKNDCVTQYAGGTEGDTNLQKFNLISRFLRYLNDIPQVANKLVRFGSKFTKLLLQAMYSTTALSWEEAKQLANKILNDFRGKSLSNVETRALRAAWENVGYHEVDTGNYQPASVQDAGANLLKTIREALNTNVNKSNVMQVLEQYRDNLMKNGIHTPLRAGQLEDTPTPMDSDFYIERHNVESLCYNTIMNPGALIRIRSPQRMGKTLLLGKLLDYATQQGYQTAKLNLQLADKNTLSCINTFRRWLADEVIDNLDPQPNIEEYWQAFNQVNGNLTRFFQKYLLSKIESPLVLAIDSFEQLFKYPDTFREFCSYLRVWHDNAKQGDRVGQIWRKLRVVLVYSTEKYPEMKTDYSPFNVGVAIDLRDFDDCEVKNLAKQYQLDEQLGEDGLSQLMKLVGGHPYFIQEAFANLKHKQMTIEKLLHLAPTQEGIYSNFLGQQLSMLQDNEDLKLAYTEVVRENKPVRLDTKVAFKLHSLGLVQFLGNDCIPRYDLLRQYFRVHLG